MLQNSSVYFHSTTTFEKAKVVLFGVPMDFTVCFRPGARFGPTAIRQASYGLEHYSLQFGDTVLNRSYCDIGDLVLPFGNASKSVEQVEVLVRSLLKKNQLPFALGGEHLISLPVIRALYERYPNLHVLHFDAHADLADVYFGEPVTHATVMKRVLDFLPFDQFFQFGIRSGDRSEDEFSKNIQQHRFHVLDPLKKSLAAMDRNTPLYLSLDIDVLDPAFAPGTGTPEAGGITPNELFSALELLRGRNFVGADFVELAPQLDPSGCTAVLGAKVVREMLLSLFEHASNEYGKTSGEKTSTLKN